MSKFDGIASANWFKNVAKSLGYTVTSVGDELAPAVMDTFKTNFDAVKELREELKSSGNSSNTLSKFIKGKTGEYKDKLSTMKSNAKSDLKSGNLYNKDRADKALGFDFGDDFDFDFSDDFGDENFDESGDINISNSYGTDPEVAAEVIDAVQTQSQVIIETANRNAEQNIALTKLQIQSDREIGNILHDGMGTINQNLTRLVDFNSSQSSAYISASLKYYEDSMRSMNEILTEIKKITSPEKNTGYDSSRSKLDSVLGMSNGLDLKGYLGLIKKNVENNWMVSMFTSMFGGNKDDGMSMGNPLDEIIANPIGSAMKMVSKTLIPNIVKKTFENFDKSFQSFIPNLLAKLADRGDFIGEALGIKNYANNKIDTKYYNKGVVPFDGVTKKAIVEVIPTYLSKIYSAISGREEIMYDYQNGIFDSKTKLIENRREQEKSNVIYTYDALPELKEYASSLGYKSVGKDLENLFLELSKTSTRFNPNKVVNEKGEATDLLSKYFKPSDPNSTFTAETIREFLTKTPEGKRLTQSIAADQQRAIRQGNERYREIESKGDDTVMNAMFNGAFDEKFSVKGKGSPFSPVDKFGKSSLDYLRDINRILLDRVPVYMVDKDKNRRKNLESFNALPKVNTPQSETSSSTISDGIEDTIRAEMRAQIKAENEQKGIRMSDEELEKEVDRRVKQENQKRKYQDSRYGVVYDTIGKLLRKINLGPLQDNFEKRIDKVAGRIQGVFNKAEDFMYRTIFGGEPEVDENGEKKSFFSRMSEAFRKPFKEFFGDIKERLVGPDGKGGLLKQMADSESGQWIKDKVKKGWEWLLGAENEEGKREGGLFSDVSNEFKTFGNKIKLYFTGVVKDKDGNIIEKSKDGESVFGNIKQMGRDFKDNIKSWLFGDKEKDSKTGKERVDGIFSGIGSMLKSGISNFSAAMFGTKQDDSGKVIPKIGGEEILKKIKERAPKSIAGGIVGIGVGGLMSAGGLGALGSLFLGPMSGLVIGMGGSFLSQSEKFKEWIFGKRDEETNERVGGIISKSTQEFFKKHKAGLIGGTAFGALKGILGFGILPSFVLGGPITGALTGLASSLIFRSDSFQKLLFGDEENNREGIFNKIKGKFQGKDFKEKAGTILTGALGGAGLGAMLSSFGTLGAFAFGPLSGAIAGVGAGIILSGKKWREKIFGDPDDDSKNGLINNLVDGVTKKVLMPAKVQLTEWKFKVQEWFDESIAEPVIDSIAPIKEEFSRIGKSIHTFFEDALKTLHIKEAFDGVTNTIKETFINVGVGITKYTKIIIEGISKPLGKIASAPFKLVNLVAEKILVPKHMREGIASVRKMLIENMKSSDFYKRAIEPVTTKIYSAVDTVTTFTKGAIAGVMEFTKDIAKGAFSFIGQSIATAVTTPFKLISNSLSGISGGISNILKIGKKNEGKSNQDIIKNIISGNTGFKDSIGALASTFIPFSATRRAAKYSKLDMEALRERVKKEYESKNIKLSDDELDKEVEREARGIALGADYREEQIKKRNKRAEERAKKKEEHDSIVAQMKDVMKKKGGSISDLNKIIDSYNGTDKEKIQEEANKIANKVLATKYGKEYKNKSKIEQDEVKRSITSSDAVVETSNHTKTIVDYIRDIKTNGVKIIIPGSNTENAKKRYKLIAKQVNPDTTNIESEESKREYVDNHTLGNRAAEMKVVAKRKKKKDNEIIGDFINDTESEEKETPIDNLKNDEEETPQKKESFFSRYIKSLKGRLGFGITEESRREYLEENTLGKTATESRREWAEQEDKERRENIFNRIHKTLLAIHETNKEYTFDWGKIFGKAGIITSAILFGMPLLSKLYDWIKGNWGSIGGSIAELLGLTDSNGDRTDSTGDTQKNEDAIGALVRGAGYVGSEGLRVYQKIAGKVKKAKETFTTVRRTFNKITGRGYINDAEDLYHQSSDDLNKAISTETNARKAVKKAEKRMNKAKNKMDKYLKLDDSPKNIKKKQAAEEAYQKALREYEESVAKETSSKTARESAQKAYKEASEEYAKYSPSQKIKNKIFGTSDEVAEQAAKETGEEAATGGSKAKKFFNKLLGKSDDVGEQAAKETAGEAATAGSKAKKIFNKLLGKSDDIGTKVIKETSDDVAEVAVKSADGKMIKNFIELLGQAIEGISKIIRTNLPKIADNIPDLLKPLAKVAKTSVTKLGRFAGKITAGIGKVLASAKTALILDIGFAVYGAASGATKSEAANLFHVPQDRVDTNMRIVSGIMKTILNISWFFVVDIANDICIALFGVDFLSTLASGIYKLISDSEADEALDKAQALFKESYDAYNITEAIAKGNVEYDEQGNIIKNADGTIKYKDESKIESFDSFNDKQNKTFLSKAWDSTTSWFGSKLGQKGDQEKYNAALEQQKALDKAVEQGLIDKDSEAYKTTLETIEANKKKYQPIDGPLTKLIGNVKDYTNSIGDYMKTDGLTVFSKEYWTPPETNDDGTIMSGWDKASFYTGRVLMMLPQGVKNIIKSASNKINEIIGNVKNFGNAVSDNMKTDGLTVFSKEYWTPPTDDDGSVIGTWDKIAFYTGRILMMGPQGFRNVIGSVSEKISNIKTKIQSMFDFVSKSNKDTVADILNGNTIFTKEYWEPPTFGSEEEEIGLVPKILFFGQRILTLPVSSTMSVIKLVSDGVKAIKNKIQPMIEFVSKSNKDSVNDILNGNTVFTKEYWEPPTFGSEEEEIGLVPKILFFGQRILTLPVTLGMSVGKHVYDGINKVKTILQPMIEFVSKSNKDSVNDILNGNTVFTKEYWEPPTFGSDNEEIELLPKILFFGQRILTLPVTLGMSVGKHAYDGIKKLIGNVKNFGNAVGSYMNTDGLKVFSSEYWTPPTDDESSAMGTWDKIAFYTGRVLMMGPQGIKNVFKSVSDGVKKLIGNISSFGDAVGSYMNTDGLKVFSSEYWTPPTNDDGSVIGSWDKVAFYTGRVLMMGPQGVKNVIKSASDGIKKIIGNVSSFGDAVGSYMDTDGLKVFSSEYWTPPTDDESSVVGTWDKIAFYTGRVLMMGPQGVKNVIKSASDGIKKIIGNVTDIASAIKGYADVDTIDSDYFSFPEGDDDGSLLGGIKRVGFYLTRGIMIVPLGIKSIFNWIGEKISGIKDWFTGIIAKIKDGLGFDQLEDGSFNFGGGNTTGYPRRTGPVSIDNVTEGIYPGGIGGSSGYDMFKQYGRQTAGYPSYSNKQPHYGVDRSTGKNSSVPSFTEGTVTEVVNRYSPNTGKLSKGHQGGFGNYVKVRDSSGGTNIYAHLNRVNVKPGSKVKTGDTLGIEGNTGNSSGTHLHYETWAGPTRNSVIDPYTYLKARKKKNIGGGNTDGYPNIPRPYSFDNITEGIHPGGIGGDTENGEEENGISKVFEGTVNVLTFPVRTIKNIGTAAFENIKSFIGNISNFGSSIKNYMKTDKLSVFSREYWNYSSKGQDSDEETTSSAWDKIAFYTGRVLMMGPQGINNIISTAFDGIKRSIGKMGSVGNTLLNSMKTSDNANVFSSDYWRPPTNDDGTAISGISSAAFYVGRILTMGPQTIKTITSTVSDSITKVIGNVTSLAGVIGDGMDTEDGVSVFSSEYWTPPTDDDGSALSGISKAAFYVGRIFKVGPQAIKNIISKVTNSISTIIGNTSNLASIVGDGMDTEEGASIFSSEYWTPPEDDGSALSGIGKAAFYVGRILKIGPQAISNIISKVSSGLSSFVGTVSDLGSKALSYANVDKIDSNYFKFPESDDDGSIFGSIKRVGFYVVRSVMIVPNAIKTLVSKITDTVTDAVESILDSLPFGAGDKIKDLLGIGGGNTSGYPKNIGPVSIDNITEGLNPGGIGGGSDTAGYELFKNEWQPHMTSPYGNRSWGMHYGYDIDKGDNAPVPSFTDGTVETVLNKYAPDSGYFGSSDGSGYGNYVMVRDSNNNRVYYAHLNKVNVRQGAKVKVGDILGLQGHTGNSTANHLHLETRVGEGARSVVAVDPVEYLRSGGALQTMTSNPGSVSSTSTYNPSLGTIFEPMTSEITKITDQYYEPINKITEAINSKFAPILGSSGASSSSSSDGTTSGNNAVVTSGNRIGDSVKQFESGNNGSATIGYVNGDVGGRSFGTYQFASFGKSVITDKSNGLYRFWNRYYADQYPGVQAGDNPAFINAWKDAVAKNPEQFAANEWEEIARNFYVPIVNKNKSVFNPDTHSRAAQDILWSTAVQYGPNTSVIRKALEGKNPSSMSASQLINTISDYKANTVGTYFSGAGQSVRNSVRNRFDNKERKVLLGLGEQGPLSYTIDGTKYGTGGDDSIWTSGIFGIGGDSEPTSFTYSTTDINKFNTTNKVPDSSTQSINELKESINDIKSSNNNSSGITDKVTNFLDKILNVLSEISDNTKNTSNNVDKLNTSIDKVKSTPPAQVNVNNNSNNAMYDVANKRREEKKNRNYSDARLIASGAH